MYAALEIAANLLLKMRNKQKVRMIKWTKRELSMLDKSKIKVSSEVSVFWLCCYDMRL